MRQSQPESNLEDAARRNKRRVEAVIAAGLVTAIVGAMAIFSPADRVQTSAKVAASNQAAAGSVPSQDAAAGGATASVDAPKPHFERTDEPAVEDSTNSHGG